MKLLLLITLCLGGVSSDGPNKDCGSPNADLVKVEFIPACEKNVCVITRGQQITILANFLPKINSRNIYVTAFQTEPYFHYETLMWQGENLCGKHNITCPLEANRMQYTVVNGTVPSNMPVHKTTFRLVFYGDNDQRLFCGTCPVEIR